MNSWYEEFGTSDTCITGSNIQTIDTTTRLIDKKCIGKKYVHYID